LGALLAVLSACAPPEAEAARPFELPLLVREDQGIARVDEPLASGIPLPPGAVFNPSHIHIYDASGKRVPCQSHQLGLCWPDGSLRWVLLQFQASAPSGATVVYTLRVEPDAPDPVPRQSVTITETDKAVEVVTGPMRITVSRHDFRLPDLLLVRDGSASADRYLPVFDSTRLELVADRERLTLDEFNVTGRKTNDLAGYGTADTGPVRWGRSQRGIDYSPMLTGPVNITVEEDGPMRAVLRIERAADKKEGDVGFVARIYAYAGRRYLRVELTLESYEQFIAVPPQAICNSKHIRKMVYRVKLAHAVDAVEFGGSKGAVKVKGEASSALRQLEPGTFSVRDAAGSILAEGDRAPGWITATCGRHTVTLAAKWFWETAPKALGYDAKAAELALELWPGAAPGPGYPIPAGRVKTYEFMVGVDTPGPQLSAMARAELRAYPDPEYVTSTGATHRFVPLADHRFSTYAEYVRKTCESAASARLYGDIDFGDQIGWSADKRWNGYHGVTHEWFLFYLASGEPELFRIAEQETWHSMDVDTQHWGYQPGCREAEYARMHDHICPAPIQGGIKVWNFGEVDYYFMTGRRRVLESLVRNARFLLNCGGVSGHGYVPERSTSLPFLHLAYMYEAVGDEAALTRAYPNAMKPAAGRFRGDSIGEEQSKAYLATLKEINDYFNGVYDRGEYVRSSFMASYPAEAFHRYYALTGDETAANGILKAARFLYNDLIIPTGIPMYAAVPPGDVNHAWMPWCDGVEGPAALAYLVSGDARFLDWGMAPADWILNLRGHAYSSGLSWQGAMGCGGTLPTFLWAMREAGMTEDDLARLRPDVDFDSALKTCREKCMEFYDVSMRNTPESRIFCRLAAEVGRVLANQGRYDEAIEWLNKWKAAAPYGFNVNRVLNRAKALKADAEGIGASE